MSENSPQVTPDASKRIAVDVGLVVADMQRALSFYRDLIGLPVVAEVTISLIGRGQMVQLAHGASLIKLVRLEKPPSAGSPAGISKALGYRYITLLIADIEAIMTKLEQEKVSIALPITRLENGAAIAMVMDPDGNIIEFVQTAGGL